MRSPQKVYLVTGFTDMRKSINGLSIIVSDSLSLDPLSQAWFVFCNKQRNKLKILFWDTNGFWLYYRRLEQGHFHWPKSATALTAMGIEQRQLQWLLSGLPVDNKTRHQPLTHDCLTD
jgi:transposase